MDTTWPSVLFSEPFRQKAVFVQGCQQLELLAQVRQSRVLLVGAGGIGSEVLKTLTLTGFRCITLVDLDTIEISNLNRQFLFRSSHVGKSKAEVAAETVRQFQPHQWDDAAVHTQKRNKETHDGSHSNASEKKRSGLEIVAHHANIKDPQFDIDFFKSFDVVLNGLDNLNARRHVNRLCFAAEVPLIESGTTGYEGSVTVHIKEHSHCYECQEKPVQKSFPICTIRNTPDRLIHCVVWAKDLLFARIFGDPNSPTDLDESTGVDGDAHQEAAFSIRAEETAIDYAVRIFQRVFQSDIESLLEMEELWTQRQRPKPLELPIDDLSPWSDLQPVDMYKTCSLDENSRMFVSSICAMYSHRSQDIGNLVFDKDDDLAMQFVASASNLRAICYNIPHSSLFDIKGMAGNIVHAIATTNATVAGLIVMEACKILSGCRRYCKESFIGKYCLMGGTKRKRDILIKSTMPPSRNPDCVACGKAVVSVHLDCSTMTLAHFLDKFVRGRLGVTVPNLVCEGFMYEEGEGLDEDEREEYKEMLPMSLKDLPGGGLNNGSMVTLQSQAQLFSCSIIISQEDDIDSEQYPDLFMMDDKGLDVAREASEKKLIKRKRPYPESDVTSISMDGCDLTELSDETNKEGEAGQSLKKLRKEDSIPSHPNK